MRLQPQLPAVLQVASRSLRSAAAASEDNALKVHVLVPVARLLDELEARFDDYVVNRLKEIDRLKELTHRSEDSVEGSLRARLQECASASASASGRLKISQLEALIDGMRFALIDVQSELEGSESTVHQELLADIWAEQVAAIRAG